MTRPRDNRLGRLQRIIQESPARRSLLREAYEYFWMFGELPEDDEHLAYEVVMQALKGGEGRPLDDGRKVATRVRKGGTAEHQRDAVLTADKQPTVRTMLFHEALYEHPQMRKLARAAIR